MTREIFGGGGWYATARPFQVADSVQSISCDGVHFQATIVARKHKYAVAPDTSAMEPRYGIKDIGVGGNESVGFCLFWGRRLYLAHTRTH